MALMCLVCTSILSETRAGTMPSGTHGREPLDDGTLPRSHYDEFVRALQSETAELVAPSDDETPNDVFPLDSEHVKPVESHKSALSFQKRDGGRFCGPVLADILEMICGKSFLSMFGKRSAPAGESLQYFRNE